MAIEKALYEAPKGLDQLGQGETDMEIEIVDPEEVSIGIDGLEIQIKPERENAEKFDANLAEFMTEGELMELTV